MPQSNENEPKVYAPSDVRLMQRTEKGLRFDKKCTELREKFLARDPEVMEIHKGLVGFLRGLVLRPQRSEPELAMLERGAGTGLLPSSVHTNKFLANFSLQYQNDEFIGERCMPVVPVDLRSDAYATYGKRDRLAAPDDSIGANGQVNTVVETRGSDNYSVKDRALKSHIDATTLNNQDAVFDEMMDLLAAPNDGLALLREKRIAAIVQGAANYAGNTTTLTGANQWDSGAGGDPIKVVQAGIAATWRGSAPTDLIGVTNLDVFNCMTRHPAFMDLLKYTAPGLATKEQLARILGLSDILVGAAREDTANIGAAANYGRIWTDSFSVLRVARRPSKRSAHFGSTFRLAGDPKTMMWFEENNGKEGTYFGKVGVSEDHKVVAGDAGFLIIDCLG